MTNQTPALAPVDSLRIDLPSTWRHLGLDQPSLKDILLAGESASTWAGLAPTERRRIELFLQRVQADLEAADARFASVYSEMVEVPGEADTALVASVVVSMVDRSATGSDLPLSPAVVQAAMASGQSEATPVLANTRTTDLAPPEIVELQHVTAVLVRRLVEIAIGLDEPLQVATATYLVTIPDDYEQLAIAQFATPNVGDSEQFGEYFAAIADSIRFYREGEETVL